MRVAVDTNVLVYRYDPADPRKQARAAVLLRDAIAAGEAALPYQTVVEFVNATSRSRGGRPPILGRELARHEARLLLQQFPVLHPDAEQLELALHGAAFHQLAWFDALMWACAERWGCDVLWSEDFRHDQVIGSVRVVNPFADGAAT